MKNPSLKDSLIVFAMFVLVSFVAFIASGENEPRWQPANEKNLINESGELVAYKSCSYNEIGCIKAYGFKTAGGKLIVLNCEPAPPINKCFDENGISSLELYGKQIDVTYFQLGAGNEKNDYKLIMSASIEGKSIFTYNQRLKYIQSTKIISSKSLISHRVARSNFIYMFFLFFMLPIFIFVLVFPYIKSWISNINNVHD